MEVCNLLDIAKYDKLYFFLLAWERISIWILIWCSNQHDIADAGEVAWGEVEVGSTILTRPHDQMFPWRVLWTPWESVECNSLKI